MKIASVKNFNISLDILGSMWHPIRKYGSTLQKCSDHRGFIKKGACKSYLAMHVQRFVVYQSRRGPEFCCQS